MLLCDCIIDKEKSKITGKKILNSFAKFTQPVIQRAFGFATLQAIYKWQQGTALPSIDNLIVLAALLDVKIDGTRTGLYNFRCLC